MNVIKKKEDKKMKKELLRELLETKKSAIKLGVESSGNINFYKLSIIND